MLEAMSGVPAYIRNGRLDILTGGALARALFAPIFTNPARPVNAARFTFLDPAATEFYPDWDAVADQNVATLRTEAGRNPGSTADTAAASPPGILHLRDRLLGRPVRPAAQPVIQRVADRVSRAGPDAAADLRAQLPELGLDGRLRPAGHGFADTLARGRSAAWSPISRKLFASASTHATATASSKTGG